MKGGVRWCHDKAEKWRERSQKWEAAPASKAMQQKKNSLECMDHGRKLMNSRTVANTAKSTVGNQRAFQGGG